ncbi:hypothetical protein INT45_013851 [Circinella minor]|uniref:Uncharacterized protein n=1 Tax=Circinella minor TaxID=1195481 RepID=A0A8H7S2C2_9FUNG|nr:hypothetical protein INT45_013851 [Circinella minor]
MELGIFNPFKQYQGTQRYDFEVSARLIHYYWTILGISPDTTNDILDQGLERLFSNIPIDTDSFVVDVLPSLPSPSNNNSSNSDEIAINEDEITCTTETQWIYYNHVQDNYLRTSEAIELLKKKAIELNHTYNRRLELYNKYIKSIQTIYDEIKTPAERRCTIRRSLSNLYLQELRGEFDQLKEVVRKMAEAYIDKFREKLEDLWDKALLTQKERAEFIAKLHEKADTMDEVHLLVDEHIKYLQRVQPRARAVARLMKQRKELIQKMVDFEKTASDPKRLFRSSFQLNEEERWRKTCFPTLLTLDDALVEAVQEFERVSGKPFIYDHCRYLDTLRDEITDRAATQTFFGFLNTDLKQSSSTLTRQTSRSKLRSATLNISPSSTTSSSLSNTYNNDSKENITLASPIGTKNKCPPSPTHPQAPSKRRSHTTARSATSQSKSEFASPRSSKSAYTSHLLSSSKLMPPTPPAESVPRREYIHSNDNNNKRTSRIPYAVKAKHDDQQRQQTTSTVSSTTPVPSRTSIIPRHQQQQKKQELSSNDTCQWSQLEEQNVGTSSSDSSGEEEEELESPSSPPDENENSTASKHELSHIETSSVSAVSIC